MSRRLTEASFQGAVIDLARRLGWRVFHHHDSRRQVRPGVLVGDRDAAGYPDLTLARDRVIFAELKAGAKLSDTQREWLTALRHAYQEVYVWTPASWQEIQVVLNRRGPMGARAP